ncbi:MATE family efflux transporter [Spiroplasma endosymbiont of Amphibalanus improvisus]|uniref:MATE family efflux transporter n=1 Tax=Spiroplasma endosymbiont of Amphibalanus improvisus TaxID=3066327 RepID=UPI00313E7F7E
MHFKLLFNDKKFIKNTFKIIRPAILQAFVTALGNLLNVFIIGNFVNVGENGVAGVSLATTLFGISILLSYSATIAGNIFAGQYYGNDEVSKVKYSTNFKVMLSLMCSLLFIVICFSVKIDNLFKMFMSSNDTNTQEIINNGVVYFKISIWTCLISSITIPLIFTTNSFEKSDYTLILISTGAIIVNCAITFLTLTVWPINTVINGDNVVIAGPAIAFLISKVFELTGVIIYYIVKKPFYNLTKNFWYIPKEMWKKLLKVWILLLPSELLFQIYYVIFTIILGQMTDNPQDVLAPVNISNTLIDISWCVINGSILGIPQLIGKPLGENRLDEAKENAKKLKTLVFLISVILSTVIFLSSFIIVNFLFKDFTQESKDILFLAIAGNSLIFFFYSNAYLSFNILRSGGIQWIPSLFDIPVQYLIQLPMLIMLLAFSNIDTGWIIFICDMTYIIQFLLSNIFFYKVNWNRNIIKNKLENNVL